MRAEPLSFKEFDGNVVVANRPPIPEGLKPLLPGGRRREAVPPPPPTFTEEQLKAAEQAGYKKGFIDGTQEGRAQAESEQASVDRNLVQTAEKFVQSVAPLLADYRRMILQLKTDMPKAALAIARKAAGKALAENAYGAVEDVAARCVETMAGEPKLNVIVHESLAQTLEKKLKDMAERLQSAGDIVVTPDAAMAVSDCKIEWKYGAMERHTGQLWEQIERATETLAAGIKHETEKQLEQLETQLTEDSPTLPSPASGEGQSEKE